MNSKNLLVKLNNYDYSPTSIAQVVEYKKHGTIPEGKKAAAYKRHWANFVLEEGDKLYYDDPHLEVIPTDYRQELLKQIYDDPVLGVGAGIKTLYRYIVSKFLGIRRTDVDAFLKSQKVYGLTRPLKHVINKPIYAAAPNNHWCIDLVDLGRYFNAKKPVDAAAAAAEDAGNDNLANKGFRYILSCIDVNTRYCWAEPLKYKDAAGVRDAMERICQRANGTYPKVLQADNGTEFRGVMDIWKHEHGIKSIYTRSYTPESNGLVENMNQQILKILREYMVRHNDNNWVDWLQEACRAKNLQYNSTIRATPQSVWKSGHNFAPHANDYQSSNLRKAAAREIKRNTTALFKVGDVVRIKLTSLSTAVRKEVKSGNSKVIVVRYSPKLYKITKALRFNANYAKQEYWVAPLEDPPAQHPQNVRTRANSNGPQRFFGSDFQLVNDVSAGREGITLAEATELNKTKPQTREQTATFQRAEERRKAQQDAEVERFKRQQERQRAALAREKQVEEYRQQRHRERVEEEAQRQQQIQQRQVNRAQQARRNRQQRQYELEQRQLQRVEAENNRFLNRPSRRRGGLDSGTGLMSWDFQAWTGPCVPGL